MCKVFLATWLEENQAVSLTGAGAEHRLMSFFFLRQYKGDLIGYIKRYVTTGIGAEKK